MESGGCVDSQRRKAATAILAATTVFLALQSSSSGAHAEAAPGPRPSFDASSGDDGFNLRSMLALPGSSAAQEAAVGGGVTPVQAGPRLVVQYVAGCSRVAAGDSLTMCNAVCPAGTTQQRPLSVLVQPGQVAPTELTQWSQGRVGCYPPAAGVMDLPGVDPAAVAEVFAAVVAPATANVPLLTDGKALVRMELIVYATVGQRQWTGIPLAGTTVAIRASPARFTWDFGDGSNPLVTEDPGAWYPDHTVFHEYPRAGEYQVNLTTTFTGEYSVAGGPWLDIPGTVSATSPPEPVRIVEARAQLTG